MHDETPLLRSYHDLYCALTGLSIEFNFQRLVAWRLFSARFSKDDLERVIRHIQRRQREGRRSVGGLRFFWLVEHLDSFEEDLAEARALARAPKYCCGKAAVLGATGRPVAPPGDNVRTPDQVMAAAKAFEEFRKLKETL